MNPSQLIQHLRRYPRWYAVGATWLAMMVVLPTVGADVVRSFAAPAAQQQPAPVEAPTTDSVPVSLESGATSPSPVAAPASPAPPSPASEPTAGDEPSESTPPEIVPPEELPPNFFDPVFDAIPGLPAVNTPPELMPVFRAVAPIAGYGCTATGLASLVLAVVAPSVEQVPVERLLPYLAPVTSACANFPLPEARTVCALDEPFVADLGGLATSPPVIGLGIDSIQAFETELIETYGIPIPRISDSLREQLDCELIRS